MQNDPFHNVKRHLTMRESSKKYAKLLNASGLEGYPPSSGRPGVAMRDGTQP